MEKKELLKLEELQKNNGDVVFKLENGEIIALTKDVYYQEFLYRLDVCSSQGVMCEYYVEEIEWPEDFNTHGFATTYYKDNDNYFCTTLGEVLDIHGDDTALYTISRRGGYGTKGKTNSHFVAFYTEEEAEKYLWNEILLPLLENDDQVPTPFYDIDELVEFINENEIEINDIEILE